MAAYPDRIDDSWWICRGRAHAWPRETEARACCYTSRLVPVYGVPPEDWPGPEPVLPFNGSGAPAAGYCWVLVDWKALDGWTPAVGEAHVHQWSGPPEALFEGLNPYPYGYAMTHQHVLNDEWNAWLASRGDADPPPTL